MLEDVAVVHPLTWPIICDPGNANAPAGRNIHGVFPRPVRRRRSIPFEHLKEEPVQVKRVVDARRVDDVPDLQLADRHGIGAVVLLAVDQERHAAVGVDSLAERDLARRSRLPLYQALDRARSFQYTGTRGCGRADTNGGERLRTALAQAAVIRLG